MGLGEGLAPSSATNVMARQVPECVGPYWPHLHHPCSCLYMRCANACHLVLTHAALC